MVWLNLHQKTTLITHKRPRKPKSKWKAFPDPMSVCRAQYKEKNTSSKCSCQLDLVNLDALKHRSAFSYAVTCLVDLGLQY